MDKLRHLVTTRSGPSDGLLTFQLSRPTLEGYESMLCFLGLPKVLKAPCNPTSASQLEWRGVEAPHLVRVPARLFILVKKMFLSKLPTVAIKHRTDPAGQDQGLNITNFHQGASLL